MTTHSTPSVVKKPPISAPPAYHPSIRREMEILNRGLEMAETAFIGAVSGALDPKICNVALGAARVFVSVPKASMGIRIRANKIAMQEAQDFVEAEANPEEEPDKTAPAAG